MVLYIPGGAGFLPSTVCSDHFKTYVGWKCVVSLFERRCCFEFLDVFFSKQELKIPQGMHVPDESLTEKSYDSEVLQVVFRIFAVDFCGCSRQKTVLEDPFFVEIGRCSSKVTLSLGKQLDRSGWAANQL